MQELSSIVFNILLPILVLVALGVWMRRQFNVDLTTLGKLNIYLFVPAFIYQKVATSSLPWGDMCGIALLTIFQVILLGTLVWIIGRMLRVSRKTLAAVAIAVMFYNSGNYGLPLAELAYPGTNGFHNGGAVQAFVMLTQNVLTFTVGLAIAASAGAAHWGDIFTKIMRMPVVYMLAAAILTRHFFGGGPDSLPAVIGKPAQFLADGLVPIAMVTMGAQLAANPRWPRWKPIAFVLVLRLIVGPIVMLLMLLGFHFIGFPMFNLWPWPAELMILTAAVPTAVNTLLVTLELDGDAELAADCVFWTTVVSTFTIAGWLWALRSGLLGRIA